MENIPSEITNAITALSEMIEKLPVLDRVLPLNAAKLALHNVSPFKAEPVDCVLWVQSTSVKANDYNPNSVAPPEMKLLEISIGEDGYTQPVVTFLEGDSREVVDGFHRTRVGKECIDINNRIHGHLPVVTINQDRTDKGDRIAATIRHNRARGKHKISAMSDIIVSLRRRCWTPEKIARELGMEADEVLRLSQITGLASLFSNSEFSQAWEADKFADKTEHIEE